MSTLDDNLQTAIEKLGFNSLDEILQRDLHPSTKHMLRVLAPNPKLPEYLYSLSALCFELGINMTAVEDNPELTAGLRKLMEAKDCFVRAALDSNPVNYNDR